MMHGGEFLFSEIQFALYDFVAEGLHEQIRGAVGKLPCNYSIMFFMYAPDRIG